MLIALVVRTLSAIPAKRSVLVPPRGPKGVKWLLSIPANILLSQPTKRTGNGTPWSLPGLALAAIGDCELAHLTPGRPLALVFALALYPSSVQINYPISDPYPNPPAMPSATQPFTVVVNHPARAGMYMVVTYVSHSDRCGSEHLEEAVMDGECLRTGAARSGVLTTLGHCSCQTSLQTPTGLHQLGGQWPVAMS